MRRLGLAFGLSLLAHAADAACLKPETDDQVAEGKLSSMTFSTPAYNLKEQAYILTLATPACLDGTDEYDKVDSSARIHVYSMDKALLKQLKSMVGKIVRVHGSPFGEMTAHHHAPIVMNISAIEPVGK